MTLAKELDHEEFEVMKSHLNFLGVGFSASAGELGTLQKMPGASGMAFLVVMHLSFEQESMAAQRNTLLPVALVPEPAASPAAAH
ncbi:MAG: hypothetical protein EOO78_13010 [Oxalobacteraceae bacterium]|nr:MAG: hypothetical protein EOO78_13010 [Oxalobacteraceae bacterium]